MNMYDWQRKLQEWREHGVIDETTVAAIHAYEEKQPQKQKIPLLLTIGLIFFTLAVFSFIAANWDLIPDLLKTAVLLVFMWIAYILADVSQKKQFGYPILFQLLGYALFIATILVTAQTFHLSLSNSVVPWLAYLAALAHLYFYHHRFYAIVHFVAGVILLISFMENIGWIEWGIFVAIALLHFYKVKRPEAMAFAFLHLFGAGLLLWALVEYDSALWPIWTLFVLALLPWFFQEKSHVIKPLIQLLAGLTGIGYLIARGETNLSLVDLTTIESSLLAAAGVGLGILLWKNHREISWIVVLGWMGFLLLDESAIVIAVLAEIIALGYLIVAQRQDRSLRGGFIFFILVQFVIYFIYAWQRLDMSLFFLIGALLLFVLSGAGWWLNRRKEGGQS